MMEFPLSDYPRFESGFDQSSTMIALEFIKAWPATGSACLMSLQREQTSAEQPLGVRKS
jgi:hypothetical protein